MLQHPKHLTELARKKRKDPTRAEQLLWERLSGPRFDSLRFRRQHVIPPYIVDFFCARARVIVELDGWSHDDNYSNDRQRHEFLEREGFEVLRFPNQEVLEDADSVADAISCYCVEQAKLLFGENYVRRRDTLNR